METVILFAILTGTYMMAIAKRLTSLVRSFSLQSLFLSLFVLFTALEERHAEFFAVAGLLFIIKVIVIPLALRRVMEKINVNQAIGMFLNSQVSLLAMIVLTVLCWNLGRILSHGPEEAAGMAVSFSVISAGLFIMIFRAKALAQVTGILVMENGVFLLGASVAGGMPFFVEIAIFLDVLISVLILNVFVYRINRMFTHIDVNKLTSLKG